MKLKNRIPKKVNVSSSSQGSQTPKSVLPEMFTRLPAMVKLMMKPGRTLSSRQMAAATGVRKTSVLKYVPKLRSLLAAGKDVLVMSARQLYNELTKPRGTRVKCPDFAAVAKRLSEPGQTRKRLWAEYRAMQKKGEAMSYVHFARLLRQHGGREVSMRQHYEPGAVAFVDFSGKRPFYYDRKTGEKIFVELFVAVLGFSHYTFVTALASQKIIDWIAGLVAMFKFFGGVPGRLVPDNLKSAVCKAGRVPVIQPETLELAEHYDMPIIPARAGRPQDKGIVEISVKHVQRHLLPELAKQKFFSLDELNVAIVALMKSYNAKRFQKRPGSRWTQFQEERKALQPLPKQPFVYFQRVSVQKVPSDYHLPVLDAYYSVPHWAVGMKAEARASSTNVQIWIDGECAATHKRGPAGSCTTDPAHQTEAHRAQALRTPEEVLRWASDIGPAMTLVIQAQFRRHKVALQGLQSAYAIQDLGRKATPAQLEAAAEQAVTLGVYAVTDMKRLLQSPLLTHDRLPATPRPPAGLQRGRHVQRRCQVPSRTQRAATQPVRP